MPQKALIVTTASGLDALNRDLQSGWRVVQVAPMGGGGATDGFAALVVIEGAETEAEALLDQIVEEMETPDAVQDPTLRLLQDPG